MEDQEKKKGQMWETVEWQLSKLDGESDSPVFPKAFLMALRLALESGLNSDQITMLLMLQTGTYEMRGRFTAEELLSRVDGLVEKVKESIERGW